ncbi:glycosyltransferase family 4 protein [Motilimonas eburnea]|uniref:glycosyltransferase family 4 protein n=1 Tax=Motilimonas eburnea TaxID=1737488 RepID=UPI001E390C3B|nr:glycosyltransferase family 4 protein [Motilimonas eburnea]MCE2572039.1 glycosyltransferase family 4 protein [Motilimonas eburnea]
MQNPVFLLLDSRQFGGIESHVLELAKGLKQAGVAVHVVLLQDYATVHPLEPLLQQQLIHCHKLTSPCSGLISLIALYRPSLFHTHGYKAGIVGRLLGLLYQVAVISSFHAGEKPKGKLAIYDFIDRYSACLAQQRIAISPIIAKRLPFTSHVVNNFLSHAPTEISQGLQIAFVGRLSREKGADRFVDLARLFPQYPFHVYGDGPERAHLQSMASSNVIFYGQQEMAKIWPKIGILVMPSRYEGLPMAAIEAMMHGIPVLAYDVGALNKLVHHQVNGYLIPPAQHGQMQMALGQFLGLPRSQKQSMQRAAKSQARKNFSAKAILPQIMNLYQQAIQRTP